MSTAFFTHLECHGHDMGRGHPESPQRLVAIEDHLLAIGLEATLSRREAPLVELKHVEFAHTAGYVSQLSDLLGVLGIIEISRFRRE